VIARAFFYAILAGIATVVAAAFGALITYIFQTDQLALELVQTAVFNFNGILVGGAGFGLLAFAYWSGARMLATLNSILDVPEEYLTAYARHLERARSWKWWLLIVTPLSIVGALVLWRAGFPMDGFANFYLAFGVSAIYVVASSILASYVYTILLFHFVEEHSGYSMRPRIRFKCSFASMDLQAIDSFFVVSAAFGVLAIYLGFRGTLTANFVSTTELFRKLMILPLVFYLPTTLCYSFYPRYVLRQVTECDTLELVDEFVQQTQKQPDANDLKGALELRALILDIKEKMLNERRATPLLTLKDAPSLTMSLIIVAQFIAQNDSVVAAFFNHFFR
jgi:hypothetical protein